MTACGVTSMRIDRYKLEALAAALEPYKEDEELFWDTLDGETHVIDYITKQMKSMLDADAQIAGAKSILEIYVDRIKAAEARKAKIKDVLKTICEITGEKKIPHPLGTISMRQGGTSVQINNLEEVPTQLCQITKRPDKTAIKKLLEAGEQIGGVELVQAPDGISIRIK